MGNLSETATYDAGVYEIDENDFVEGSNSGDGTGIDNAPHKALANRTKYLKAHLDVVEASLALGYQFVSFVEDALAQDAVATYDATFLGKFYRYTNSNQTIILPTAAQMVGKDKAIIGFKTPEGGYFSSGLYLRKGSGTTIDTPIELNSSLEDLELQYGGFVVLMFKESSNKWYIINYSNSSRLAPAGIMQLFTTAVVGVPTGFLECDGAAVSRTTYLALFLLFGTTYGAGNGTTTFNLPDLAADAPALTKYMVKY